MIMMGEKRNALETEAFFIYYLDVPIFRSGPIRMI